MDNNAIYGRVAGRVFMGGWLRVSALDDGWPWLAWVKS